MLDWFGGILCPTFTSAVNFECCNVRNVMSKASEFTNKMFELTFLELSKTVKTKMSSSSVKYFPESVPVFDSQLFYDIIKYPFYPIHSCFAVCWLFIIQVEKLIEYLMLINFREFFTFYCLKQ